MVTGQASRQPGQYAREWAVRQAAYRNAEILRSRDQLEISVNMPRPLDDIALALTREHGWHINYEDPFWTKSDLVENTAPEWLASHPYDHVFGVRGGRFHTTIPICGHFPDDPIAILATLVESYNQSANPGSFRLQLVRQRDIDWFDIIPVSAGDGPQTPLLDTVMSFDATRSDDAFQTMERFAKELSAASGYPVISQGYPLSFNPDPDFLPHIAQHSSHQPAREILRQMLPQISTNYSWRLFYDTDRNLFWLQWR